MLSCVEALNKASGDGSEADMMWQALHVSHGRVGQTKINISAHADDVALIDDAEKLIDTHAGVGSDL